MEKINYRKLGGLVPAIIQDGKTKKVLMLGFMNRQALKKTLDSGTTWFWSRTRKKLWHKGEQSGHYQKVRAIYLDCDHDTLLVQVFQEGGSACHTGRPSCFFRKLAKRRTLAK